MHQPPPDVFARGREHRRRVATLEQELEEARAALSAEIALLTDRHGLSDRAVAEGLGYRSGTSVRRARTKHQPPAAPESH